MSKNTSVDKDLKINLDEITEALECGTLLMNNYTDELVRGLDKALEAMRPMLQGFNLALLNMGKHKNSDE